MNLENAVDLKKKVIRRLVREVIGGDGAKLQTIAEAKPDKRMAVGISRVRDNDYRLELRPQRATQFAYNMAREFQSSSPNEVNIRVLTSVEMPKRDIQGLGKPQPSALLPIPEQDGVPRLPLRLGLSVGRGDSPAGTLGGFVTRGDAAFLLSCNHVLALLGEGKKNDDHVYSPGRPDQKPLGPEYRVATLASWVDFDWNGENNTDAAIAKLNDDVESDGNTIPTGFAGAGKVIKLFVGDPADIGPHQRVRKLGRSTGETLGEVTATSVDQVPVLSARGMLLFADVIEVQGVDGSPVFSDAGDSGSLVYTATDTPEAIGIIFAGGQISDGTRVSYVCRLTELLSYTRAQWLA